jgi:tetratricopeptide (TPR) repeat protein
MFAFHQAYHTTTTTTTTTSRPPCSSAKSGSAEASASRKASTSTQSTIGTSLLSVSSVEMTRPRDLTHNELENIANEYIVSAYNLVWVQKEYSRAVSVLQKALEVQRSFLGKHHKDVGYTCHFIATAYWLQDDELNGAMRYFLEARRIFCKLLHNSTEDSDDSQTTRPLLQGIDDRIHCILIKFRLEESDIQRAKQAIDRTIAHELRGDRLKAQGKTEAAKEEYRNARKVSGVLRQLM